MPDEHDDEELDALEHPRDGVPPVVDDPDLLERAVDALTSGTGPVAVDAERASGYRYGQSAYLVQLRREGAGTWLVDPVPLPDLSVLDAALADTEWVLHAATQDIPCLAELGLRPRRLFDTELGARIAGLPRVGLSSVLEYYLGVTLAKEHSAVDWSTRPLPEPWLRYAALDVELLVELRHRMERDLVEQGKLGWAAQEFDALTRFTGPEQRPDPWRRTSGMHRVRTRRGAATVRELWRTRDELARHRDVTPGRILPDATLIDLAMRAPESEATLHRGATEKSQTRQRRAAQGLKRHAGAWVGAIRAAAEIPDRELPDLTTASDAPPPPRAWADRDPVAAARLTQVKEELAALSEHYEVPVENLLTPDTLRRVLWRPPDRDDPTAVAAALTAYGARPWQCELVAPVIAQALKDHPAD
ncbi:HRDC domain-containing protein [Ornithinimicrobium sediminis]|uniref:HRDC domain-containing protein n=1 Tax=Ornithinimicrobium sediminis TaxID=2904603 RepID=UPI001E4E15D1|nr:HRDC domain-containing protein [Ornithinimicrobium sediminis]MCE0487845.1 HRDC domain-containing protein [Ornithinimicrobium sediminis]